MNFKIDKQTIEELNLTGKFRSGSVYAIFNKVKTNGGERLLDHMFRHPLEDEEAINERSSIFRYFGEAAFPFPFDVQQLNQMREHIDSMVSKNAMLVFARTCIKRSWPDLHAMNATANWCGAAGYCVTTPHKCHQFVQTMRADSPFTARVDTTGHLADKRIEKIAAGGYL